MRIVRAIFWNSEQNRLKVQWRIPLTMILFFIILIVAQILAVLPISFSIWPQIQAVAPEEVNGLVNDYISESLPLQTVVAVVIFLGIILAIWLAGRFIDRRQFASFGFHFSRNWWIDFGFGLAAGAVTLAIAFLIELGAGWVTITGMFQPEKPGGVFIVDFMLAVIGFICVGIQEELLFRGYGVKNIAEGLGFEWMSKRNAVLVSWLIISVLFGLAHLSNPNATWVSAANIVIAGLLLGLGYIFTGELAIPIGMHITWNLFEGNVFGFPVSGTGNGLPSIIVIKQSGPDLWTGGAFGPEAGLVAIIAMLIGGGLVVLWVRWRYGKIGIAEVVAMPPGPVSPGKLAESTASA